MLIWHSIDISTELQIIIFRVTTRFLNIPLNVFITAFQLKNYNSNQDKNILKLNINFSKLYFRIILLLKLYLHINEMMPRHNTKGIMRQQLKAGLLTTRVTKLETQKAGLIELHG